MLKIFKSLCLVFFIITIVGVFNNVQAQCAMCQATVESNINSGGSVGKGLNDGIMYLLAAPYIAMAAIGYLWYKKYRKKDVILDIENKKINLN
jgi:hypothetical protein